MSSSVATADRPARERAEATRREAPLVEGPRWYRNRIRIRGPFAALIVPGVVGLVAYSSLQLFDTASSGVVGLVGGVLAAPVLLLVGAPFGDRELYPPAVLASAIVWMLIGLVAAFRATRNPLAGWREFWKQFTPLLLGVWAGALAAMLIATISIGDTLF